MRKARLSLDGGLLASVCNDQVCLICFCFCCSIVVILFFPSHTTHSLTHTHAHTPFFFHTKIKTARIWNFHSGEVKFDLRDHSHVVECVAWAPKAATLSINILVSGEVVRVCLFVCVCVCVCVCVMMMIE